MLKTYFSKYLCNYVQQVFLVEGSCINRIKNRQTIDSDSLVNAYQKITTFINVYL